MMLLSSSKQILGLMLFALIFVISCSAKPVTYLTENIVELNESELSGMLEKRQARAMKCVTPATNVKICYDTSTNVVHYDAFSNNNYKLKNNLPSGSYTSYSFCGSNKLCTSMASISGTKFNPQNYKHVADKAVSEMKKSNLCMIGEEEGYPTAIDIYLSNYNFVFSWWFEGGKPPIFGYCR